MDPSVSPQVDSSATAAMGEQFNLLRRTLAEMNEGVAKLSGDTGAHEAAASMRDGSLCLELGFTLYMEANRAVQAGAWFAASAVAASSLESLLLAKCFFNQDEIKKLPKWGSLKKSHKLDFGLFARSMDLGKLLEIAEQLSWFPSKGLPQNLVKVALEKFGREAVEELTGFFADSISTG